VAFLQPYIAALRQYPALAHSLETATRGEPAEQQMVASIAATIRAYVSGWAAPVIRRAQRDLEAARRAEAAGGGKVRVDAMRAQFAVLLARESVIHSGQVGRVGSLSRLALASGAVAGGLFLALIAVLALRTQIRVVAPLRRLASAVAMITAGNLSVRVRGDGAAEVGELVRGFNEMAAALERQRQDLADHQDELEGQKVELEGALSSLEERNQHI
jgi:HAMP domain-containing protein